MGSAANVLAWNVAGHNCPNMQGDVKWVRTFAYDVAIIQESKLEVVSR